jgi:hypothetical protein
LIAADSSSNTRRKKVRAVWEETKEAAKKRVDTALLKEMDLVDWAQATNEQHARRLSEHPALKAQTFLELSAQRTDEAREHTCRFSRGGPGAGVELGGEALVAPFAVELRHLIRGLEKHRALPERESVGVLG